MNRSDATPAIVARRVSKRFLLRHNRVVALKDRLLGVFEEGHRETVEPFWALTDVSLQVQPGESVGLVGRNGSGKSTLLKLIAGIFAPTSGALYVHAGARVGTMIELGVGFHNELTAIENIYLNASIHGLERHDIAALVPAIVEYSGLANFMDVPLKGFSSGMHMRLAFAIAANLQPNVLLIDEVFAVGDADFQTRCVATLRAFRERGCTVLFVSHTPAAVREVCTRVVVLQAGRVMFDGGVQEGLASYAGLVAAGRAGALPGGASRPAPSADPDQWPARLAMGGHWRDMGPWALDFLRRDGLRSDSAFLDAACGSLPIAVTVLPFLDPGRYWGYDADRVLVEHGTLVELPARGLSPDRARFVVNGNANLGEEAPRFDFALAHSMGPRISDNALGVIVAGVVRQLAPGGRFYLCLPVDRPSALSVAQGACAAVQARMEPVAGAAHPRGDTVWIISA